MLATLRDRGPRCRATYAGGPVIGPVFGRPRPQSWCPLLALRRRLQVQEGAMPMPGLEAQSARRTRPTLMPTVPFQSSSRMLSCHVVDGGPFTPVAKTGPALQVSSCRPGECLATATVARTSLALEACRLLRSLEQSRLPPNRRLLRSLHQSRHWLSWPCLPA